MLKGSPAAAGRAAAVSPAAHEAVTRPFSVVNKAGHRSRSPLRHALAWVSKLTILAAYVAGVYLAVAVGLGALTPWSADWQSAMRLAAVAITAAGFAAVRRQADVVVDRLFLPGPSRYEVLTSFAGRLRAAGPLEEALPSLARLLGEGTEARQAAVWLRSGPAFVRAAVWPASPAPLGRHSITEPAEADSRDDIDVFAEVHDGGQLLGALSVALPAGRRAAPPDIRLVTDLANSAGFLLRSTLLTTELSQRLRTVSQQAEELHKSRRRLVVARDIARRRLAHEMAVSVQGALHAIGAAITALQTRIIDAAGDQEALPQAASQARAVIKAARAETDVLIARFRSVVHGIYPPALSDHGLPTAVESLAATLPRTTRIAAGGLRRYPMEVESPLYFCAAVALRGLAAGPHAIPLRMRLADTGRNLVLTIIDESRSGEMCDDERALLDEMSDHAGACGGAADAAEIGGSLWLLAVVPLHPLPQRRLASDSVPDGSLSAGHLSPAGWSEADGAPARQHTGRQSRADRTFWIGFTVYSAWSAAWLALGLAIGITAHVEAVRSAARRLAEAGHQSWVRDVAASLMAGLPRSYPAGQVALDYAFSALSIAIAVALLWLARRDAAMRLLAVGMVGLAGAFSPQAHSELAAASRLTGIDIGWWQPFLLQGVGGMAYVLALVFFPAGRRHDGLRSRWAEGALACVGLAGAVALLSEPTAQYPHTIGFVAFGLLTLVVGITAQWRRYVAAATADARQQSALALRALILALGAAVLLSAGGLLIGAAQLPGFRVTPQTLAFWIFRAVFAFIPCALMLGVLRFRRWDVERLFNRALVYGLLAMLIGVVYVALVVGADVLLGLPMRQNPLIQIAATVAVALALAPARTLLSRLADRLAYGQRPAPYHVLARLSALSQATHSGVATLPSLARIVGDGLGARSCEVRLIRPDGRLETRSWHAAEAGTTADAALRPGAALLSVPVVHRGVTVGEIRVVPPLGGLAPGQRRLLTDLANGAGLVLHNARLAFELKRRLTVISRQAATISASRRRIAAEQAQERQTLERNLHDGAQPHLVAVRMSLGLAEHRTASAVAPAGAAALNAPDRAPELAADLVAVLQGIAVRVDEASASLSEIAQGLYPPKLMEEGLRAALQAHITAMPGEIKLELGDGMEHARFGLDVETAVCFACLEALQNARKHAPDAQIRLTLALDAGGLRFTVVDTGPGIDPEVARGFGLQSMDDRVAAVGGTLEFRSQPSEGTTVSGWVPAEPIDDRRAPLTAA